jgi:hypothetical protein
MHSITRKLCTFAILFTTLSGVAQAQRVDFVTGGGYIFPTASNGDGTFGFVVRNTPTPSGNLTYIDHGTGMVVHATSFTTYTFLDANTRQVTGTCEVNGVGGFTFTAFLRDIDEPSNDDEFGIEIPAISYIAHDRLAGGNIQLHPL